MKVYNGIRSTLGTIVTVDGRDLPWRLDLDNHSPTGLEWGYGGSGPAQLALAILADALGNDRRALRLHQRFKWRVVGGLPKGGWRLTLDEVLAHVRALDNESREDATEHDGGCL